MIRGGGRVGAIEWLPFFVISSTQPAACEAFNGIFRKAIYDYFVLICPHFPHGDFTT
jgi:hypothetical protein